MALIKKLTKIGNSYGVILPLDLLNVAGLKPEGDCEIQVDKEGVHLKPVPPHQAKDQDVIKAMARFVRKYQKDLKKLAS